MKLNEKIELAKQIVKEDYEMCKNVECANCILYTECDEHLEKGYNILKFLKEFIEKHSNKESVDNINSPNHYKLEGLGIESIEIIKARLGQEGFKAFCVGNALKYIIRAEKKNGIEDYKKAQKYLEWIIKESEK